MIVATDLTSLNTFGFEFMNTYRKLNMAITTFLCIMILLLLVASMAGWTDSFVILQQSAWATGTQNITNLNTNIYYGLQGYTFQKDITHYSNVNIFEFYHDCSFNYCQPCKQAGQVSMSLTVLSFFMMFGTTYGSVIRWYEDNDAIETYTKVVTLFILFIIWIFVMSAFSHWNQTCYKNLIGNDNKTYHGMATTVVAWVFLMIVFILHLITPTSATAHSVGVTIPISLPQLTGPSKSLSLIVPEAIRTQSQIAGDMDDEKRAPQPVTPSWNATKKSESKS